MSSKKASQKKAVQKRDGRNKPKGPSKVRCNKVCDLIASGLTIDEIGELDDQPAASTIRRWKQNDPDFDHMVRAAREHAADILAERALREARATLDECRKCPFCEGDGNARARKVQKNDRKGSQRNYNASRDTHFERVEAGKFVCGNCLGTGKNPDQRAVTTALREYLSTVQWLAGKWRPGVYHDRLPVEPERKGLTINLQMTRSDEQQGRKVINVEPNQEQGG